VKAVEQKTKETKAEEQHPQVSPPNRAPQSNHLDTNPTSWPPCVSDPNTPDLRLRVVTLTRARPEPTHRAPPHPVNAERRGALAQARRGRTVGRAVPLRGAGVSECGDRIQSRCVVFLRVVCQVDTVCVLRELLMVKTLTHVPTKAAWG
jgi:hypothetical protein